jgi:hypothetical protein
MSHVRPNCTSHYRENIVIKRAENVYPDESEEGDVVGAVASYVHSKVLLCFQLFLRLIIPPRRPCLSNLLRGWQFQVGADIMPANMEVSKQLR